MEKKKSSLFTAVILFVVTALYTVLVCVVDKQAIGPNGTVVGFATMNGTFRDALGEYGSFSQLLDKGTDLIMLLSFLALGSFVVIGFIQLIKRKSLLKVDKAILLLAAVYVVMVVLYVLFDKLALNYRPILLPEETELEASFPSSHALVICTIFGTAIVAWGRVFGEKKSLLSLLRILAVVFMVLGVAGRLIAGVHWLTDIIAGVLYAATLVAVYVAVLDRVDPS